MEDIIYDTLWFWWRLGVDIYPGVPLAVGLKS